jgi:5-methylcytosine-specific restriction endonuclease McrA
MQNEKTQPQLGLEELVEASLVQQSERQPSETERREVARERQSRINKEQYLKHKARRLEKQRQDRRAKGIPPRHFTTKKYRLEYQKAWVENNRDKTRARDARYRAKPGFKAKNAAKSRRWRAKNKEKMREYNRLQRQKPANQIARRKSHIKRRAAIMGATIKPDSIGDFIALVKSKRTIRCYYCKRRTPTSDVHFDHIVPVSKGGLHSVGNLCTACPKCNVRKSNHSIESWNKISTNNQTVLPI